MYRLTVSQCHAYTVIHTISSIIIAHSVFILYTVYILLIQVEQYKDKMTKWKEEISAVRKEYNHLLLFMIPKLKLMEDIIAKEGPTKKIGRELVHLSASSQPVTRVCTRLLKAPQ